MDFNVVAKRAKDNAPPLATELVKGQAFATRSYGPNPDPMSEKRAERKGKDLLGSLYKSATATKLERGRVLKGLNDSAFTQFLQMYNQMPQNQGMNAMFDGLQQLAAHIGVDISKTIGLTSPLTSSFAPFDLVAPSRLTYPVYSPS